LDSSSTSCIGLFSPKKHVLHLCEISLSTFPCYPSCIFSFLGTKRFSSAFFFGTLVYSSLDGTHLCRSNDNTGHWHCPAGYVRVTRAPYCRLLLLRGSGGGGGGHRHGQQGATVPPADATLGESATTIATAATAATPITAANSVRAARARSVLAGGRGSAASEAFSTAAPKAPAAGAPAGAVEGLASEPCTMHTYFGSKVKRQGCACLGVFSPSFYFLFHVKITTIVVICCSEYFLLFCLPSTSLYTSPLTPLVTTISLHSFCFFFYVIIIIF